MLIHWIWLATRPGLHDGQKLDILQAFRDPEEIFFAERAAYANVEGITPEGVQALADKNLSQAQEILDACIRQDIRICTFHDAAYPNKLKNIADPPLVLYYKGTLEELDMRPVIGVVGTRKASVYGLTAASRMGYQIARCGGILEDAIALSAA